MPGIGYLCANETNKQRSMIQKTTANNINIHSIVSLFIRSKSFAPVRLQYNISYNMITMLLGAYIYYMYVNESFHKTRLQTFVGYFNWREFNYCFNGLIGVNMITLAGAKNKYIITPLGIETVNQISNNTDNLLYSFCDKYNIVL